MRRRYIPDIVKQMADCEANYVRLMRLLPDFDNCDEREFEIHWQDQHSVVRLQVEERFTYTTTVRVSHLLEHDWLKAPCLLVRMYHDARAAEVICIVRGKQLRGVYQYPNMDMRHPDEKAQLNQYLGEWLNHCLNHGHVTEAVFSFD